MRDFFKFGYCVKYDDIKDIFIVGSSEDGWNIDSIATFAVVNKKWAQTSADLEAYRWVRYFSSIIIFPLSIKPDAVPYYTCFRHLYLMAFTSGIDYAGSDGIHMIEIKVKGSTYRKPLPNLPGDDYSPLKGDLWKLDINYFGVPHNCIIRTDIEGVALLAGSSDGWNIDSVFTYTFYTNSVFQLFTADVDVYRWLDTDSSPEYKHFQLTLAW